MFIGIDIGSISVKFALVALPSDPPLPEGTRSAFLSSDPIALPGNVRAYLLSYDRILGDPNRKVPERLTEWIGTIGSERIRGVAVTGKNGGRLAQALGARYENDFRCLVRGVTAVHREVRTIFEMGGENAKVIRLEQASAGAPLHIRDYDASGDCAAGTGSFIDQQANRMRLDVEEIGEMVARAGSAARIAGAVSAVVERVVEQEQHAVIDAPEHESPGRTVPEPGEEHGDEEVLEGACGAPARAAE